MEQFQSEDGKLRKRIRAITVAIILIYLWFFQTLFILTANIFLIMLTFSQKFSLHNSFFSHDWNSEKNVLTENRFSSLLLMRKKKTRSDDFL